MDAIDELYQLTEYKLFDDAKQVYVERENVRCMLERHKLDKEDIAIDLYAILECNLPQIKEEVTDILVKKILEVLV